MFAAGELIIQLENRIDALLNSDFKWPDQISASGIRYIAARNDILFHIRDLCSIKHKVFMPVYTQASNEVNSFEAFIADIQNKTRQAAVDYGNLNNILNNEVGSLPHKLQTLGFQWAPQLAYNVAYTNSTVSASESQSVLDNVRVEYAKLKETRIELDNTLENLSEKSAMALRADQMLSFDGLSKSHRRFEIAWLITFTASLCAVFAWIFFVVNPYKITSTASGLNIPEIAHSVIVSTLVLASLTVILKVAYSRYIFERNLKILYKHRLGVLTLYPKLEAGIESNQELRNGLRLELAKFIYSDPQTNQQNQSSDININPFIQFAERVIEKSQKQ